MKCFTDYSLESIRMMNETSTSPLCNNTIKLKRTKNTYPKTFWEADLVDDIRNYEVNDAIDLIGDLLISVSSKVEYRMFCSPTGNDQYHLTPYRIYRKPICDVINTVYRHSLMEDIKSYSNMPYSKDKKVNLCDLMPMVKWCKFI